MDVLRFFTGLGLILYGEMILRRRQRGLEAQDVGLRRLRVNQCFR